MIDRKALWAVERDAIPDPDGPRGAVLRSVADAVEEQLGGDLVAELAALPASAPIGAAARAWHGSPVSDVRSFLPTPAPDESELLGAVTEERLVFGHTHLPFRRIALRPDGPPVELVNPGSVGLPFDGDRRAAYALLHDDGRVEHVRLPYDHAAAIAGVQALAGDAPWGGFVAAALDRATFPS